jgi:hypothetical protein
MLPDCHPGSRTLANHHSLPVLLPTPRCGSEQRSRLSMVPSPAWLIALPAHHARVAAFGVRQPCCRDRRAHDPVRGMPLALLTTGMLYVLVTIM